MTDTFWGLSATAWTAITTLLTAGLLAVAIAAAIYAARQIALAREQADEARQAAREASRPYVLVTVEPSGASPKLFDLVVRNIGQRPAFAVKVVLDPPPTRAEENDGFELAKLKLINEPIAMIAPGQELRVFYDSHLDRSGRTDLPTAHAVSLDYVDSSGHAYAETAALDLDALRGAMYVDVKTVHDATKAIIEIRKTLSNAGILSRTGTLDVEATVEPRSDREQRDADERSALQEQHARLTQTLFPGQPDPAPAGDAEPTPDDQPDPGA